MLLDILKLIFAKINEITCLDQYHVRNGHDISPGKCSLYCPLGGP